MDDNFLLNESMDNEINVNISASSNDISDLDSLFDNLTNDINSFNKYVEDVNQKKKENILEEKELIAEKLKIDRAKIEFENYIKTKNDEYEKKMGQVDEYLESQKQVILRAEAEFKSNMDNSLNELELEKKELEIQKEKFKQEKDQFENYKTLELNRIQHAQKILDSEREQFEKYKEINTQKIELENKNLQQKCDKFKELLGQFNLSFKPIKEEE